MSVFCLVVLSFAIIWQRSKIYQALFEPNLRRYSLAYFPGHDCQNRLKDVHRLIRDNEVEFIDFLSSSTQCSWRVFLAEKDADARGTKTELFRYYDFTTDAPWSYSANKTKPGYFSCAEMFLLADKRTNSDADYLMLIRKGMAYEDVPDAAVIIVESTESGIHWMEPKDLDFETLRTAKSPIGRGKLFSYHDDGVNVLRKNGEVVSIKKDYSKEQILAILEGAPAPIQPVSDPILDEKSGNNQDDTP